jgi:hypothetical protein
MSGYVEANGRKGRRARGGAVAVARPFSSSIVLFLAALFTLHAQLVQGLYMSVGPTPKCLRLDKPQDTPITFMYEILDSGVGASAVHFQLYYGDTAREDMTILSQDLRDASGKVEYVTDVDGFHLYCVHQLAEVAQADAAADAAPAAGSQAKSQAVSPSHPVTSSPPTRFQILVDYGYSHAHYQALAQEQGFDAVNVDVRKLNDMLDLALNEAHYTKYKEMEFHDQTEAMNEEALWWPVAQICILVVIGVFQARHLKFIFKQNKLI